MSQGDQAASDIRDRLTELGARKEGASFQVVKHPNPTVHVVAPLLGLKAPSQAVGPVFKAADKISTHMFDNVKKLRSADVTRDCEMAVFIDVPTDGPKFGAVIQRESEPGKELVLHVWVFSTAAERLGGAFWIQSGGQSTFAPDYNIRTSARGNRLKEANIAKVRISKFLDS